MRKAVYVTRRRDGTHPGARIAKPRRMNFIRKVRRPQHRDTSRGEINSAMRIAARF